MTSISRWTSGATVCTSLSPPTTCIASISWNRRWSEKIANTGATNQAVSGDRTPGLCRSAKGSCRAIQPTSICYKRLPVLDNKVGVGAIRGVGMLLEKCVQSQRSGLLIGLEKTIRLAVRRPGLLGGYSGPQGAGFRRPVKHAGSKACRAAVRLFHNRKVPPILRPNFCYVPCFRREPR